MPSTLLTNTQTEAESSPEAEPSRFVWYQLHTPDSAAAAAFYGPVLGWTTQDASAPSQKYTLVCVNQTPIGGLLEKPVSGFADDGKARWMGYLGVHDAQLFSERVKYEGGVIHRPIEEIPGVGTFAAVADPQGAFFTLFQPPAGMTRPEQPPTSTPGMPAWHDLVSIDGQSAFQFYSDLFGWTKHEAIMCSNAVYQIFAVGAEPMGGMVTSTQPEQPAGWMFYFRVEETEAAAQRVKQNGGTVILGPMVVPGGEQVAHCLDPQGALFGIVGPGKH